MRPRFRILALLLLLNAPDADAVIAYRISGLSDFNLSSTPWSITDPAIAASMDVCAYTSLAGVYAITATSVGGFKLVNGINAIPYTLSWEDSGAGNLGSSAGAALTNGVALQNRLHSNNSALSNDCSSGTPSGPTARLYLTITKASMIAAPASITPYVGTLFLTVSPL